MGLEIVELIMRIEEEFEVEIPDQDAEKLTTVGHIADYLSEKLTVPVADRDAVWEKVREIVVDQFTIPAEKVQRSARLIEDLNLG